MPVDFFFLAALLLHLLGAIAMLQPLDSLPTREQQHADEEHTDSDRSPLLLQPALVDLADDRIVPNVFLDGVFECFGRCAHKCFSRRTMYPGSIPTPDPRAFWRYATARAPPHR